MILVLLGFLPSFFEILPFCLHFLSLIVLILELEDHLLKVGIGDVLSITVDLTTDKPFEVGFMDKGKYRLGELKVDHLNIIKLLK